MIKQGQRNRGSKLGEHIFQLSKHPEVKNIVEIGTWNGLGTTKCIYDGILASGKRNYLVYSLECNFLMHSEAKINLIPLRNFNLLYGTIVPYSQIKPVIDAELEIDPNMFKDNPWLKEESAVSMDAPNVLNFLPEKIDLLILDGGEYSSSIEFDMLSEKARFIVLDDTSPNIDWIPTAHPLKNSLVRKYILSKPEEYKIIDDNLNESNGYLICERKN